MQSIFPAVRSSVSARPACKRYAPVVVCCFSEDGRYIADGNKTDVRMMNFQSNQCPNILVCVYRVESLPLTLDLKHNVGRAGAFHLAEQSAPRLCQHRSDCTLDASISS